MDVAEASVGVDLAGEAGPAALHDGAVEFGVEDFVVETPGESVDVERRTGDLWSWVVCCIEQRGTP